MKKLIFALSIIFLTLSCESKIVEPTINYEKVTDYYPLSIGNYWVYKVYTVDSNNNYREHVEVDSLYVEKDSLINGKIYKLVRGTFLSELYLLRDSSNYLVTAEGKKLLTTNKTDESLAKRTYSGQGLEFELNTKMNHTDSTFNTPSGNYKCKFVKSTLKCLSPNSTYNDRKGFYAYSKGVGMIGRKMSYLLSDLYVEMKLIRYDVKY
jgi:hypothetical protein